MMEKEIQPLGHASPHRYKQGAWTTALLQRMTFWVKKLHAADSTCLDIGCGEGALLNQLGYSGIGIDLNIERLVLAKARHLDVMIGDGTQLPFMDKQFKTVISMEVLEHVPDMTLMMQDVFRVLEDDGVWIISVPSVTLRSRYEMWREKKAYYCDPDEHYREFSPVLPKGFEHKFMLISDFKAMFEHAGFKVEYQDGVRYIFPQWLSRISWLQKLLESPNADRFWSMIPWVRQYPYWTILVLSKETV
jgi:SAM-dependent methyltransferase